MKDTPTILDELKGTFVPTHVPTTASITQEMVADSIDRLSRYIQEMHEYVKYKSTDMRREHQILLLAGALRHIYENRFDTNTRTGVQLQTAANNLWDANEAFFVAWNQMIDEHNKRTPAHHRIITNYRAVPIVWEDPSVVDDDEDEDRPSPF